MSLLGDSVVIASLLVLRSFWGWISSISFHMFGDRPSVQKKGAHIMKCAFSKAAASVMLSQWDPIDTPKPYQRLCHLYDEMRTNFDETLSEDRFDSPRTRLIARGLRFTS